MSDLTAKEQENVRIALRFLRARLGANGLAKAVHAQRRGLRRILGGQPVTASLAVRVARLAKVGIDDVLAGKYPPPGTCPMCGHRTDPG